MDFVFADDARQTRPTRPGMGELVAVGGVRVPDGSVRDLEQAIEQECARVGFPPGERFKWSPGNELWMRTNLKAPARTEFFKTVLGLAVAHGATALFVMEDKTRVVAEQASSSHEEDATKLFLERVHNRLKADGCMGVVVADRPGGGRSDEDRFLAQCLEVLQVGTTYVRPDRIALNVITTSSTMVRLLQLADVVASCTLANVAGEARYSPPVIPAVLPLFRAGQGMDIGGWMVKLHPDMCFMNLYHWIFGDSGYMRGGSGFPLPSRGYPYSTSASVK